MILLEGYVYHDKIVQVSTEHLRNHNPALSYSDFAEIWSLWRPGSARAGRGLGACLWPCVLGVLCVVCWVEGLNCLKAVILTAADISRLEELGGEQD